MFHSHCSFRRGGEVSEISYYLWLSAIVEDAGSDVERAIVVDGRRRHHFNNSLLTSNHSKTAAGVKHFSRIMFHSHCCFRGVGGQRDITLFMIDSCNVHDIVCALEPTRSRCADSHSSHLRPGSNSCGRQQLLPQSAFDRSFTLPVAGLMRRVSGIAEAF